MNESDPTQPIDVTGQTPEDAIEAGLAQLGLARSEIIIEIIEEGSKGMLGLGAREAVVRLTPLRTPRSSEPVPAQPDAGFDEDFEDDSRIGRATLAELLDYMHIQATVDAYRAEPAEDDEDAPWVLDVKGADLGILIGRRGETLNALQYITRLIVSRELQRRANIVVDVEGYKTRRESTLRKLAQRMADQARKLGRTVSLEPMPPNERRIIHITLRDDITVTTESVGAGDRRKVTIIPTGGAHHQ
jgi:spoIIIJ-associated protein